MGELRLTKWMCIVNVCFICKQPKKRRNMTSCVCDCVCEGERYGVMGMVGWWGLCLETDKGKDEQGGGW